MGWWSEGIMGGDTPLDIQGDFDDRFGIFGKDEDGDPDGEFLVRKKAPPMKDIEDFYRQTIKGYGYKEGSGDICHASGPIAFLCMRMGWPLSAHFKKLVIEQVESEDLSTWRDPEVRKKVNEEFVAILKEYKGGPTNLPHQQGLFEKIVEFLDNNG